MMSPVIASGRVFLDAHGRQMILRGVNLGGDCKVPVPAGGTHLPSDFADHRSVSFVGRPFPIEEADEHLGRLRHWGFNCLRLIFTWEAVEHAGPGQYDQGFLDYYEAVAERAAAHGLYVFADPHQDAWSRMTGGDGAPGWTLEAAGIDISRIGPTNAAHVMQNVYDYASPEKRQAAYPQMSWSSNYTLPANAIMWSLFWMGRELTPRFEVEGRNIQDHLQGAYLGVLDQIARRLAGKPNVIGFDTLNEPNIGWLGRALSERITEATPPSRHGASRCFGMSPLEGLALADGQAIETEWLDGTLQPRLVATSTEKLNQGRQRLWRDGFDCPFRAAGLYEVSPEGFFSPRRDEAFQSCEGRPLRLEDDVFKPFFDAVARTIRAHNPGWSLFAELDAWGPKAGRKFPAAMPERSVNASHWYDGALLYNKRLVPVNGARVLDEAEQAADYARRMSSVIDLAESFVDPGPSLVGEFGIPFDLNEGEAFARWAAGERGGLDLWTEHELALGIMYDALDANLASSTQWNYTASNSNDLKIGDHWNQEDLSIFSRDQQTEPGDLDSGGRAVDGFCRPYVHAAQGKLVKVAFDRAAGRLELEWLADPSVDAPTEVYLPRRRFGSEPRVDVQGAPTAFAYDAATQILKVRAKASGVVKVAVGPG